MTDPEGAKFPWKLQPLERLNDFSVTELNDAPCVVLFVGGDEAAGGARAGESVFPLCFCFSHAFLSVACVGLRGADVALHSQYHRCLALDASSHPPAFLRPHVPVCPPHVSALNLRSSSSEAVLCVTAGSFSFSVLRFLIFCFSVFFCFQRRCWASWHGTPRQLARSCASCGHYMALTSRSGCLNSRAPALTTRVLYNFAILS